MRGAALALALVGLAASAARAGATDVSPERLRQLAADARSDPAALSELRSVDSVAGRPVDVERLLADAEGDALEERLEVLGGREGRGRPPADARRQARDILAERRFEEPGSFRPLRAPLEWLRDRVRGVLEPIVSRIAPHVPGGRSTVWTVVALIVVALAVVLASRIVRRRTAEAVEGYLGTATGQTFDPRRLEREAEEAERSGDLERALRLRFRAGLARLQRAELIPARDSVTSGEVARRLRSADFDRVAATFDEVVYGRRRPEPADVEASRAAWSRVLEAAAA